jgi:hypothetical protein
VGYHNSAQDNARETRAARDFSSNLLPLTIVKETMVKQHFSMERFRHMYSKDWISNIPWAFSQCAMKANVTNVMRKEP